jgi:hypothetical protein
MEEHVASIFRAETVTNILEGTGMIMWEVGATKAHVTFSKEGSNNVIYPEIGGSKFLQNVGTFLPDYMVSQPTGLIFIFSAMTTSNLRMNNSLLMLQIHNNCFYV